MSQSTFWNAIMLQDDIFDGIWSHNFVVWFILAFS